MDIPSSPSIPSSQIPIRSDHSYGNGTPQTFTATQQQDEAQPLRRTNINGIPKVTDATGEKLREGVEAFLSEYTSPDGARYYIDQIHGMRVYNNSTLYIDFAHFNQSTEYQVLGDAIREQYYRFHPFVLQALYNTIKRVEPTLLENQMTRINASASESEASFATSSQGNETERIFMVAFYGLSLTNRIRDMHTDLIGHLTCISGTVTRTSEVRPELFKATFKCDACQAVVKDIEQHFKYTEPTICPTVECGNRTSWTLDVAKSTFVDWQKVRIQENPEEIPTGSMPRTMDVIVRGDIVEKAKAGDKSQFTGTLTVVPDVSQYRIPGVKPMVQRDQRGQGRGEGMNGAVRGLKELGARELSYRMCFMATMVQDENAQREATLSEEYTQEEFVESLTEEERQELDEMAHSDNLYSKLVHSIAPTVFGHEMIKKGILLQMMGGLHKTTPEGIQLRGDINVCIVGDPSTSKSQFLKYVCGFMPRAVYTSGKASSAAGLTAAVVKDEETGEFTIEAGALMLADNGICAIDEFDKMDVRDQVAIHEAMEQQTISIAKAGIHATLNARASILAAANPVGGRYNHRLGLRQNVNMSAPIMSRFDVFFVVLDECNQNADSRLADHIVGLHMDGDDAIDPPFSTAQMQRYIQFARTFKPQMTPEAQAYLVEKYKELRKEDTPTTGSRSYRITVRQLESLIRLSEAVARVHCTDEVTPEYVREAYNLLRSSTIRVDYGDVNFEEMDHSLMSQRTIRRLRNPLTSGSRPRAAANSRSTITREKYNNMVNFVVGRLGTEDDAPAVPRSSLVQAWLSSQEWIDTPEDLEIENTLFGKVIKRMIKQSIIMEILGTSTFEDPDTMDDEDSERVEPGYVLHPNSAVSRP